MFANARAAGPAHAIVIHRDPRGSAQQGYNDLRLRLCTILAAIVATLAAACSPAGAARLGQLPAGVSPLGHAGRWITDAQGRVVLLHGVNMVYKRGSYAPDAAGFDDDDAQFLADNGFNAVRVGVIYKAVEPQPGVYDDTYLARIKRTVDMLTAHGIYSLLDFHQDLYNERFQGEGFPDWAVFDDGLPHEPGLGFPGNYLGMPALERAFDHFWLDDVTAPNPPGPPTGLQEHYAAAWAHVAAKFVADPHVLGYDLFNEPWPGSQWSTCANPAGCPAFDALLKAAQTKSIAAIRTVDRDHLVWPEPNVIFNDGAATNIGDVGDAKTGLSFHDYCLVAGTVAGGSTMADPPETQSCDTFEQLVFKNADSYSQSTGAALLLSEWGATNDYAALRRIAGDADRYMDSWLEWHYCACDDPTTSGAGASQALVLDPTQPPTGTNVNADKLDVLSRPYPQAVAGTPGSYSYDPASNTFTLSYSTAAAGGDGATTSRQETEIFIPRVHYPGAYAVHVTGGQVDSPPGAPLLRVHACPGAKTVGVTVAPGSTIAAGGC